ncbi:MAG: hypothetical protein DRI36_06005 [Caldiserica bacterium]|nr:MAG: hypothetical protein DRI36_06005 [Caldisericota bacterium]
MKRIGIDIDGVLTDTANVFLDYVYRIYGKRYTVSQITDYFFEEVLDLSIEEVNRIWEEIFRDNIWENLPPIDGAVEVVQELQRKYPIYIITARPEIALEGTKKWLENYGIKYEKLIIANLDTKVGFMRKENINLTYFIEDRWEFAVEFAKEGIFVFLLNQPWNIKKGDFPGVRRVNNWKEIGEILL